MNLSGAAMPKKSMIAHSTARAVGCQDDGSLKPDPTRNTSFPETFICQHLSLTVLRDWMCCVQMQDVGMCYIQCPAVSRLMSRSYFGGSPEAVSQLRPG